MVSVSVKIYDKKLRQNKDARPYLAPRYQLNIVRPHDCRDAINRVSTALDGCIRAGLKPAPAPV